MAEKHEYIVATIPRGKWEGAVKDIMQWLRNEQRKTKESQTIEVLINAAQWIGQQRKGNGLIIMAPATEKKTRRLKELAMAKNSRADTTGSQTRLKQRVARQRQQKQKQDLGLMSM